MQAKLLRLYKNDRKTPGTQQPDYLLSAGDGDEAQYVGAGWIKDAKNGSKFISIKLNDKLEGERPREGFTLVSDTPVKETAPKKEKKPSHPTLGSDGKVEYPEEEINPEDIPF